MSVDRDQIGKGDLTQKVGISVQEIPYERPDEVPGWSRYLLDMPGATVGTFYVGPETATLSFGGSLDFQNVETDALGDLPHRIDPSVKSSADLAELSATISINGLSPEEQEQFKPALARDDWWVEGDNAATVEFNLRDTGQRREYDSLTRDPNKVTFMRYDAVTPANPIKFSVTITPKSPLEESRPFMDITLPRGHTFSPQVLDWAIGHHQAGDFLRERLDVGLSVGTLSRLNSPTPVTAK